MTFSSAASLYFYVYKAGQYEANIEPNLPALVIIRQINIRHNGQAVSLEEEPRRDLRQQAEEDKFDLFAAHWLGGG